MRCTSCRSSLSAAAAVCPACGASTGQPATGVTQRLAPPAARAALREGRFPVCASTAVRCRADALALEHDQHPLWLIVTTSRVSWFKTTLTTYICTDCGYLEQHVADPDALETIREKRAPVG